MVADFVPGPKIDSGVPREMFLRPTQGPGNVNASDPIRHQWSVAPDGQRFLVRMPTGGPGRLEGGARSSIPGSIPTAINTFTPPGQTPAAAGAGRAGRAGGRGGVNAPSLTVILEWTGLVRRQ